MNSQRREQREKSRQNGNGIPNRREQLEKAKQEAISLLAGVDHELNVAGEPIERQSKKDDQIA